MVSSAPGNSVTSGAIRLGGDVEVEAGPRQQEDHERHAERCSDRQQHLEPGRHTASGEQEGPGQAAESGSHHDPEPGAAEQDGEADGGEHLTQQLHRRTEGRGPGTDRHDLIVGPPRIDPTGARDPDYVIELLDLVQPQPLTAAGNGPGPKPTTGAGGDQERGRQGDDLRVSHAVCPGDLLQIRIHVVDVEAGVDQRLPSRRQQHQHVGGRFGTDSRRSRLRLRDLTLALPGEAQQHKTHQDQDGEGDQDRAERNSSSRAGRWRGRSLGRRALGLSGRGSRAGARCRGLRRRGRRRSGRGEGFSRRCSRRSRRGEFRAGVVWRGASVA